MRKSTKAMLMGAVAGMGMAMSANAAPIVTTKLLLTQATINDVNDPTADTDSGVPVPQSGGVYQLNAGDRFFVTLAANITAGTANRTDTGTGRNTSTRNKPLGIASLTANILSPSNGAVTPINNGSGKWALYADDTPDGFGFPSTNVSDQNADGVIDVAGAGFANLSLTTGTSAAQLSKTQYGVDPSEATAPGTAANPFLLVEGEFLANGGLGNLTTQFLSNNLFAENTAANDATLVTQANTPPNEVTALISVNVPVPEPTSLGLLSLGGLALVRRRRSI